MDTKKEDIVEAILFAESESDWEEVDKLYKILFRINDSEARYEIKEEGISP